MKKYSVLIAMVLVLAFSATALAATPFNVGVTGKLVDFTDNAPYMDNGCSMLPLRDICRALEINAAVDGQKVDLTRKSSSFSYVIGSDTAVINGQVKELQKRPVVKDGTMYIPTRLIVDSFGAKVRWVSDIREVQICGKCME